MDAEAERFNPELVSRREFFLELARTDWREDGEPAASDPHSPPQRDAYGDTYDNGSDDSLSSMPFQFPTPRMSAQEELETRFARLQTIQNRISALVSPYEEEARDQRFRDQSSADLPPSRAFANLARNDGAGGGAGGDDGNEQRSVLEAKARVSVVFVNYERLHMTLDQTLQSLKTWFDLHDEASPAALGLADLSSAAASTEALAADGSPSWEAVMTEAEQWEGMISAKAHATLDGYARAIVNGLHGPGSGRKEADDELHSLRKVVRVSRDRIHGLESDLDQARSDAAALDAQVQALEALILSKERDVARAQEHAEKHIESELDALTHQLRKEEESLREEWEQIAVKETQLNASDADSGKAQRYRAYVKTLVHKVTDLKDRIAHAETLHAADLDGRDRIIDDLRGRLIELSRKHRMADRSQLSLGSRSAGAVVGDGESAGMESARRRQAEAEAVARIKAAVDEERARHRALIEQLKKQHEAEVARRAEAYQNIHGEFLDGLRAQGMLGGDDLEGDVLELRQRYERKVENMRNSYDARVAVEAAAMAEAKDRSLAAKDATISRLQTKVRSLMGAAGGTAATHLAESAAELERARALSALSIELTNAQQALEEARRGNSDVARASSRRVEELQRQVDVLRSDGLVRTSGDRSLDNRVGGAGSATNLSDSTDGAANAMIHTTRVRGGITSRAVQTDNDLLAAALADMGGYFGRDPGGDESNDEEGNGGAFGSAAHPAAVRAFIEKEELEVRLASMQRQFAKERAALKARMAELGAAARGAVTTGTTAVDPITAAPLDSSWSSVTTGVSRIDLASSRAGRFSVIGLETISMEDLRRLQTRLQDKLAQVDAAGTSARSEVEMRLGELEAARAVELDQLRDAAAAAAAIVAADGTTDGNTDTPRHQAGSLSASTLASGASRLTSATSLDSSLGSISSSADQSGQLELLLESGADQLTVAAVHSARVEVEAGPPASPAKADLARRLEHLEVTVARHEEEKARLEASVQQSLRARRLLEDRIADLDIDVEAAREEARRAAARVGSLESVGRLDVAGATPSSSRGQSAGSPRRDERERDLALAELVGETAWLRAEVEKARTSRHRAVAELDRARAQLEAIAATSVGADLRKSATTRGEMAEMIDGLTRRSAAQAARLEMLEHANEALEHELRVAYEASDGSGAETQRHMLRLQEHLTRQSAVLEDMLAKYSAAEDELGEAHAEKADLTAEVSRLRSDNEILSRNRDAAGSRVEALVRSVERNYARGQERLEALERAHEGTLVRLQKENTGHIVELDKIERRFLKERHELALQLQADFNTRLAALQAALVESMTDHDRVAAISGEYQARMDAQRSEWERCIADLEEAHADQVARLRKHLDNDRLILLHSIGRSYERLCNYVYAASAQLSAASPTAVEIELEELDVGRGVNATITTHASLEVAIFQALSQACGAFVDRVVAREQETETSIRTASERAAEAERQRQLAERSARATAVEQRMDGARTILEGGDRIELLLSQVRAAAEALSREEETTASLAAKYQAQGREVSSLRRALSEAERRVEALSAADVNRPGFDGSLSALWEGKGAFESPSHNARAVDLSASETLPPGVGLRGSSLSPPPPPHHARSGDGDEARSQVENRALRVELGRTRTQLATAWAKLDQRARVQASLKQDLAPVMRRDASLRQELTAIVFQKFTAGLRVAKLEQETAVLERRLGPESAEVAAHVTVVARERRRLEAWKRREKSSLANRRQVLAAAVEITDLLFATERQDEAADGSGPGPEAASPPRWPFTSGTDSHRGSATQDPGRGGSPSVGLTASRVGVWSSNASHYQRRSKGLSANAGVNGTKLEPLIRRPKRRIGETPPRQLAAAGGDGHQREAWDWLPASLPPAGQVSPPGAYSLAVRPPPRDRGGPGPASASTGARRR